MRILLVEDDTLLRAQLRAALQGAGYTVDEADNGRDAQFLGETEAVDAVVLDLGLPVVDGLTVLKRWRAAGRTMPVLILTARDNWHEKVAGIDAGAGQTGGGPCRGRKPRQVGDQFPVSVRPGSHRHRSPLGRMASPRLREQR